MNVHVIGAGRLGSALIEAISHTRYYRLKTVVSAHWQTVDVRTEVVRDIALVRNLDGLVFICVPDDKIKEISELLCDVPRITSDTIFTHVSGAMEANELEALQRRGFTVASFHPMQTFTSSSGYREFEDTLISIEGTERATAILESFALAIKGRPLIVDSRTKTALHIAGVMVSNFMSALFLLAADSMKPMNPSLDQSFIRENFASIAQVTLNNIVQKGFPGALTGPASRGDVRTVEKHLSSLSNEQIRTVYIALSERIANECLLSDHPLKHFLTTQKEKS